MDISPVRVSKKPREVPMFKSAQWDDFSAYFTDAGAEILNAPPDADINTIWTRFQEILQTGTKRFIKHRLQKANNGLPYITPTLRKMMRKRDRLYDRMKKTRRHVSMHNQASLMRAKYQRLKARVQQAIRQAYWSYVASIILPE